jgi:homoserine O-acetyltransferase
MRVCRTALAGLLFVAAALISVAAPAADYPAPKENAWVAKNFRFHTGEVLPELRLAYVTIGEPSGKPVLLLHGTGGSAGSMLTPAFAGELFGPGQPLDAATHYIIIPDGVGHGKSTKPSDGLKAKFPKYNYDDMVAAQHRLITEGLGIRHLRLIIGNSMGGMQAWIWSVAHPGMMDAVVPMASQPSEMASRNWMMRRLMTETIRRDPDYQDGNYTAQPRSMKLANLMFATATNGGTLAYRKAAPTRAAADKIIDERLAASFTADANDFVYAWESSRDYNASPGLERVKAAVLAINAADDERNPPETGIMVREIARVPGGRLYIIPASAQTRGHGTTGFAKFYKTELAAFLSAVPPLGRLETEAKP